MAQLTLSFSDSLKKKPIHTASSMKFAELFQYGADKRILMRVKPVNYVLNSSLIVDCINRNKVAVVGMDKGTFFFIEGNAEVTPLNSQLTLSIPTGA